MSNDEEYNLKKTGHTIFTQKTRKLFYIESFSLPKKTFIIVFLLLYFLFIICVSIFHLVLRERKPFWRGLSSYIMLGMFIAKNRQVVFFSHSQSLISSAISFIYTRLMQKKTRLFTEAFRLALFKRKLRTKE